MYRRAFAIALTVLVITAGAAAQKGAPMKLESTAFQPGQPIPAKYTCQGEDVSPALAWSDVPQRTKSLALIADDPDAPAGAWVHWVLFNLPATAQSLPEGVPKQDRAAGAVQGRNDFGKTGYGGPCPPPGKPHRYFFKLYALDSPLDLKAGATKKDVERAMQGHVAGQAELMGTYKRR